MGRYYTGDIEGKFWFAVQSSDDATFFGAEEQEASYIPYYADDLSKAEEGIQKCLDELGEYKQLLDTFFENSGAYNDAMLVEAGIPENQIQNVLEWYARLELGIKIRDCIKEQGECSFDAEL